MASVSTHVLDAVTGTPAPGVPVTLATADGTAIADGVTDGDGRIGDLAGNLDVGVYRIRFDTDAWFATSGDVESFYPEVVVSFRITDATRHHHVPIVLSPFAYSTYRGS
ncbi:hydroxyisourate hydrolase [Williamsia deligens]|uniref:5-hydroxyisourate hydrolase n=1 Tax=Williamsia deligens TaxID=321325 RepID=A0ABW3G9W3_9NOCA|nr:hydroxyisourate hydrolase [Williamsia deligens]MCP2193706.1 5-hydroxyisourate hydrolase [Williamsia deligens]